TQQQKTALAAFLRRPLTDLRVANAQPPFDHPSLCSGSARAPQPWGSPTPGSGGIAPRMVALAPPAIGNPQFTVGIEKGRGGSLAVLLLDTAGSAGSSFGSATLFLAMSPSARIVKLGLLAGSGPGNGWGSLLLDLPDDPSLVGTQL